MKAVKTPLKLSDLWIQTKGSDDEPPRLTRFAPNDVQRGYLAEICPDWETGGIDPTGLREIVLKARQFGFSTLIIALLFLRTINNADTNTVIIADEATNTEELFAKVRLFWENLPDELRPATKRNNIRQLYFPALRSRIKVLTAGKKNAGRSQTIHNLHCSEVPHWSNPAILTGLLQAVPRTGNVFLESTAKGEDSVFCEQFRQADAGHTPYAARFFAWWKHTEYEVLPPRDFARTDDEVTLAIRHGLDAAFGRVRADAKLYWRRLKMSEPGMGSLFAQEYPADAKEAFLVSGKKFFSEWDEEKHTFPAGSLPLERFWHYWGGYDWGIGAPACFLLGCIDDKGKVLILDEVYGANRTTPEQTTDVKACLARWNLKPANTPIYADPSMFPPKRDITTGVLIAQVNAFYQGGLRMVPAANDRVDGWANVKRYLHDMDEDGVPFLRISRACVNLIRTLPLMVISDKDTEDADTDGEDHAPDTARYLLTARPRPSHVPDPDKVRLDPRTAPARLLKRQAQAKRKL